MRFRAAGLERSLVHDAGKVGAGHPDRALRDRLEVDVIGECLRPGVDLEDLEAVVLVGQLQAHRTVEPAGPQQSRIEHVGPVGRTDHDHALRGLKPSISASSWFRAWFCSSEEEAAAPAAADPAAPDRIELVDEDDCGRVLTGLLEQIPDTGRPDSDVELDEVRAGDRVELRARLSRQGPSHQRLAAAGGP